MEKEIIYNINFLHFDDVNKEVLHFFSTSYKTLEEARKDFELLKKWSPEDKEILPWWLLFDRFRYKHENIIYDYKIEPTVFYH